jgi:hypothetical protein
MLSWALTFLIIAIIAGVLGLGGLQVPRRRLQKYYVSFF